MPAANNLQVLLVTPSGCDAKLIGEALKAAELQSEVLKDIASAIGVIRTRDVGALMIAEEALGGEEIALLGTALRQQPSWSALPLLLLTTGGKETLQMARQERRWLPLGNAILLERPVRVATIRSSVKSALHTRSSQYERRLSEAALRHNEKLAVVGRLASSIAHEISNPLEAVMNLFYLLKGTNLSTEQQGYLDTARQELMRVSEIAAHTLTFNRQRDIRAQASLSALLDSVLVLYQGRLAGSQTAIERRYRNTPPFACYPGELRQLLANLIGNALDATRNSGRLLLRERAARHPKTLQEGVWVTVADTGHGMSADVKAHLFQAFETTKGTNGSGLGLWISKGIVEKHGGTIWLRSSTKPGCSGSVFSIFIPLDRRTGEVPQQSW